MWKLILKNLWSRRRRNGWLLAELILVAILSWYIYGHQNELCKIERRQKCCCGLFISELNENGLSCERKTKCDIALQTLYV